MLISCKNIGDVKKDIVYWFGVVFALTSDETNLAPQVSNGEGPSPVSSFGKVTFKIDRLGDGDYGSLDIS